MNNVREIETARHLSCLSGASATSPVGLADHGRATASSRVPSSAPVATPGCRGVASAGPPWPRTEW